MISRVFNFIIIYPDGEKNLISKNNSKPIYFQSSKFIHLSKYII